MPIRYTSPGLGGHRQVMIGGGEWEFDLSYRQLNADDFFVGNQIVPEAAPGGQPNRFKIHTFDVSVVYGVSDRFSLRFTVPFSTGENSRIHRDEKRHVTFANGIGDISLAGKLWLFDPAISTDGNLALGLGVKAPTGADDAEGDLGTAAAGVIQFPVHPGLQTGDGGWAILLAAEGYRQIFGSLSGYLGGAYQITPKEASEIPVVPGGPPRSVFDVYHLRAGLAYGLTPNPALSASFGLRIDGVPVRDLVGGDGGYRTPGYTLFFDPGISLTLGRTTLTASVPLRLHGEFQQNVLDMSGEGAGTFGNRGDLASYLIFLGFAQRF